jgi:hypothetical protein
MIMNSKRLVYTHPEDGRVCVVTPAPDSRMLLPRKGSPPLLEPEGYWLERIAATVIPKDALDVHVVDAADIPADRTFRNAWKHQARAISVDMGKAREVHRDAVRVARKPMLAALDVEWQKAQEANDNGLMQQVSRAKQLLRDAPANPAIEAAQTPEELKAIWPIEIVGVMKLPEDASARPPTAAPTSGWVGQLMGSIEDSETLSLASSTEELGPSTLPLEDSARRSAARRVFAKRLKPMHWESLSTPATRRPCWLTTAMLPPYRLSRRKPAPLA